MRFQKEDLVDLSFPILLGKENFKFEAQVFDCMDVDPHGSFHRPDIWYIESEFTMSSHVSTHIEFPYHHEKEGSTPLTFPLERLVGEAVVMNVTGKKAGEPVTLEDVMKYKDADIREGDFIFFRTGFDANYRKENWEPYPPMTEEALDWVLNTFKPGMIGTDASTVEILETDCQPNHHNMFKRDIPLVESLTNLDQIEGMRTTVFVLSLAIDVVDACPVRVLAIKNL